MFTRRAWFTIIGALSGGAFLPAGASALPAFPGAQGCGSETVGGRGGRVIAVTTLADHGPGSLREAVTAEGPRTIVFHVAGEIRLESHLRVTQPFVTVAGQTAPGDGITLRDAGLYVETHDVVIRFIRCRIGASLVEEFDTQDALQIGGDDTYNVVVDHCSFSWAIDECASVRAPAHDVTLSWNIVSEALAQPFTAEQIGKERSHSMALILSGSPTRCTLHHNLLAHCSSRNPRIQGGRHAFVNNVVYDWRWLTGTFSREPEVNFVGNYYKPGPASLDLKPITEKAGEMGRAYVEDNVVAGDPFRDEPDEWSRTVNAPASDHRVTAPFELPPVTATSAAEAYDAVLRDAGATIPARDAVDARVVRDVRLSMGGTIDRPDEVGGFPELPSGGPPLDTDGDGMPDDWELASGFNPRDPADGAADATGDGYTNLEAYLAYLVSERQPPRSMLRSMVFDKADGAYAVSCDGVLIPTARVGGDRDNAYAFAWFAGERVIDLSASAAKVQSTVLRPERFREGVERDGRFLHLRVNEEGTRVVRPSDDADAPRLVLCFDAYPRETPHPADDNVIDATRFGVVGGRMNATYRLQAALDACSRLPGGGVVFLPSGQHEISMIRIPTGVTLYLGRSAMLFANGERNEGGTILFDGVENAGLAGPGVVDGRGADGVWTTPTVTVRDAKAIRIADAVLRDPSGVGVDLVHSEQVTLERVKVMAGRRTDAGGVRIDGCRGVTCDRCYFSSTADAVHIESTGGDAAAPVEDVAIRQTVLWADAAGIAIGPEVHAHIADVRVRDVDVVSAQQGIHVVDRTGAGIEHLVFRDMTMHLYRQRGGDSGRPFIVRQGAVQRAAPIRDVLFDRIRTNAFRSSDIGSTGETGIEDVKFWGIEVTAGDHPVERAEWSRPSLFHVQRVRGAEFRFIDVIWPANKDQCWDKLLRTHEVEELKAPEDEITETTAPPAP